MSVGHRSPSDTPAGREAEQVAWVMGGGNLRDVVWQDPDLPVWLLELGAQEDGVVQFVAAHPHTTPEMLTAIGTEWTERMRGVLDGIGGQRAYSATTATQAHGAVLKAVATNPNTPPETLERLVGLPYHAVDSVLATNSNTAQLTLRRLSERHPDDFDLLVNVFTHPNCPDDLAEQAALSVHSVPASAAVATGSRDTQRLVVLARHPRSAVRRVVAQHATDPLVIRMLASDPTLSVRLTAMSNPVCDPSWRDSTWSMPEPDSEDFYLPSPSMEDTWESPPWDQSTADHIRAEIHRWVTAVPDDFGNDMSEDDIAAVAGDTFPVLFTASTRTLFDPTTPTDAAVGPPGLWITTRDDKDGEYLGVHVPDGCVTVSVGDCGDPCEPCEGLGSVMLGRDEDGIETDRCPTCDGAGYTIPVLVSAAATRGLDWSTDDDMLVSGGYQIAVSSNHWELRHGGTTIAAVDVGDPHPVEALQLRAAIDAAFLHYHAAVTAG